MKSLFLVSSFVILGFLLTCKSPQIVTSTPIARQIKPEEVKGYHDPVNLRIAWFPYKDLQLKQTKDHNYVMVESDSSNASAIPVILITYPDKKDSIWIQMDTSNELFGKLLKHTLMTKMPIKEPFDKYLEESACTLCHPDHVKVDFSK